MNGQSVSDFFEEASRLDEVIKSEYQLYCKRYNVWDNSGQSDEIAQRMAQESERIIKFFYHIKYGMQPSDNVPRWLAFWSALDDGKLI